MATDDPATQEALKLAVMDFAFFAINIVALAPWVLFTVIPMVCLWCVYYKNS